MQLPYVEQARLLEEAQEQPDLFKRLSKMFTDKTVVLIGGDRSVDSLEFWPVGDVVVQCNHHVMRRQHSRCEVLFTANGAPISINDLDQYDGLQLICAPVQSKKAHDFMSYAKHRGILFLPYVTQPRVQSLAHPLLHWSVLLANAVNTIPFTGVIALAFLLSEPWQLRMPEDNGDTIPEGAGLTIPQMMQHMALLQSFAPARATIEQITIEGFNFYRTARGFPVEIRGHHIEPQRIWTARQLLKAKHVKVSNEFYSVIHDLVVNAD